MNISVCVISCGAGGRPEVPVAEGGPVGFSRRGEPTGLVPRGAGAKGGLLHHIIKITSGALQ